jgi:peptide/nickel transport system substrate-binding protein
VTILVPNTPDNAQTAEVVQSMVAEAGFDLKINLIESAASLAAGASGAFQTYLQGWSGRTDPDGNLYSFLHSGQPSNYEHYENGVVDAALDAARVASDPAERIAEYAKMMAQVDQDVPVTYLYHPVNIVGLQAKLTGFRPIPDGLIRLQGLVMGK